MHFNKRGKKVDEVSFSVSEYTLWDMFPETWEDDEASYAEEDWTICTTGKVNVRKGPSTDYNAICVIQSGTYVTYSGISAKDDRGVVWYNILYDDAEGWISSKYAKIID